MEEQRTGIYKINFIGCEKVYIGSAKDLKVRRSNHTSKLRSVKHENCHLQRACILYGLLNLQFEILELCNLDVLRQREQYWLDLYDASNPDKGYNFIRNVTEHWTKSPNATNKRKEKFAVHLSTEHNLIDPNGQPVTIFNLRRFCKENNIDYERLRKVSSGHLKSHNGWLPNLSKEQLEKKRGKPPRYVKVAPKTRIILAPNGERIKTNSIKNFCAQNGLNSSSIYLKRGSKGFKVLLKKCGPPTKTHIMPCLFSRAILF